MNALITRSLFVALITVGALSFGKGSYLQVKAILAQWLIEQTWSERLVGEMPKTPWSWADTNVVAMLKVPALNQTRYVMSSDSGQSLAFGPGHLRASSLPSQHGHSVIAGHRDSHFSFLNEIRIGDWITTENYHSQIARYRVIDIQIIDTREQQIPIYDRDLLTLVTCFPFDETIAGGPLRYLVLAEKTTGHKTVGLTARTEI